MTARNLHHTRSWRGPRPRTRRSCSFTSVAQPVKRYVRLYELTLRPTVPEDGARNSTRTVRRASCANEIIVRERGRAERLDSKRSESFRGTLTFELQPRRDMLQRRVFERVNNRVRVRPSREV